MGEAEKWWTDFDEFEIWNRARLRALVGGARMRHGMWNSERMTRNTGWRGGAQPMLSPSSANTWSNINRFSAWPIGAARREVEFDAPK
jgi:hypothetical protein